MGLALGGLVYLVLPGLAAPPPAAAAMMASAGVAWGAYSLLGRAASDPLAQTTGNFFRSVPLTIAMSLLMLARLHVTIKGASLAAANVWPSGLKARLVKGAAPRNACRRSWPGCSGPMPARRGFAPRR